jgi:hypothetical protein
MGYTKAKILADTVQDKDTLSLALQAHLQMNHYPPVNLVFVPTAIEAINYANNDDWQIHIEMPNGIVKTAMSIVEELHLDAFLLQDEY